MKRLSDAFVAECKSKLLDIKRQIMNRVRSGRAEFETLDRFGGDEADQTMSVQAEYEFLSNQYRLKDQLLEIEFALARIQDGRFGICEETDEPIEIERLRVLPWTRLSIEGAEIREATKKKYAR